MKNRDKWITIAFLIFILAVPLLTLVRGAFPQDNGKRLEEQKEILENNGTLQGAEEPAGTEGAADTAQDADTPAFARLQNMMDNFTDRLFGRAKLIAFNTSLTSLITGGSYIESTQALLGKNDMFFYKTELDGHPIWDYMGINHFTDEELSAIAQGLTATRSHLQEKGIEFYTLCVPNKEIIYEENMPDTIARVNKVSRGEQLAGYLQENTDLAFVYPKDALLEAKQDAQIWYKTDTHCNQKGSFVIMQELFRTVYGTHTDLDSASFRVDRTDLAGDLVGLAGLADKYPIDTIYVFETESADAAQYHDQTLLLVGDSFGGFLSAVLKGYYKEVHWIWPDKFQYSMYEEYKPDVVILERAERYCEQFANPILIAQ